MKSIYHFCLANIQKNFPQARKLIAFTNHGQIPGFTKVYTDKELPNIIEITNQFFNNRVNQADRFHYVDIKFKDWKEIYQVFGMLHLNGAQVKVSVTSTILQTLYPKLDLELQQRKFIFQVCQMVFPHGIMLQYQKRVIKESEIIFEFETQQQKTEDSIMKNHYHVCILNIQYYLANNGQIFNTKFNKVESHKVLQYGKYRIYVVGLMYGEQL